LIWEADFKQKLDKMRLEIQREMKEYRLEKDFRKEKGFIVSDSDLSDTMEEDVEIKNIKSLKE
jgi:hypothetical protein